MSEAFVVTSGEYSDYRIIAIFDNKEIAEEYITLSNAKLTHKYADLCQLEIHPLNSTVKAAVGPFITIASSIDKAGNLQTLDVSSSTWNESVVEGPAERGTKLWVSSWGNPKWVSVRTTQPVENDMLARKAHREKVAQVRQEIIEGYFDWKKYTDV